jgi:UDP:flavonoid glycosyltransferase YjiC (YdhE family)
VVPAAAGMRLFLDEAIHVLPKVHAALDTDRHDIVLYDIGGMAGPVAAERWGVPAIQVSPSMVAWVGERYRFVGPCIDPRREDPGDWTPPPGDGPLTLLAFGSSYTDRIDLYRNAIDALEGTGWRLTIATGRVAPDRLGAVPDWVQVRATVPQPAVLSAADAFVTHAGMGSCTEALW